MMTMNTLPSLNRIILINTHMSGIVELKLNGHTNICGTNASGKTTLQRLIPVFYGEYPSRVVPATRDSFERWYLPTEQSFIIYEYIRSEDETCQMVLSSSGSGVDYRLVSKAFDIEDYAAPSLTEERHILTAKELSRNLKRDGVICSRILNTKEFKAIIQNDRAVLSSNRDLPGFARLFSLCQGSDNLRHIEKLAKAVHSKEGKMETIKAMVAAILEEDGVQAAENKISHNKVEEWIREVKLVKGFEDIRPEFNKLEKANIEFTEVQQRLSQLKQQLNNDLSKIGQKLVEDESSLEQAMADLKVLERDWNEQREQLQAVISEAKGDIGKLETDLDNIESDFERWQDQDIETLKENLDHLPRWKSQLVTHEARYTLLTEKHQDIEATYHRRKSEINEQHGLELAGYNEQKEEARETLSSKKAEQQIQLSQNAEKFKQQIADVKADYLVRIHTVNNQITELNTLINNVGFTANEQSQIDILEHTIKEASSIEDAVRDKAKQAEGQLFTAKQHREQVNTKLELSRKQVSSKQREISEVENLLYPGQNTLLEFLRREKEGWEQSIGKLIHPDMLQRTDLHPALTDEKSALFGVLLQLESVAQPSYAGTEIELKTKLEILQNQLGELIELQGDNEDKLTEASKQVRNAELTLAKIQTELSNAEHSRKRSQQDKVDVIAEFQQALQIRKQANIDKLAQFKSNLQQIKAQQDEVVEELNDQQREAKMELTSHWQLLIADIEQQLMQIDGHISKCKLSVAAEIKSLDAWLKDELANRGVDVDEIGQLKRDMSKLSKDIATTEKNSHLVAEYKHWYNTYYMGHKVNWQQQLSVAKTLFSDTKRQLDKQLQEFKSKVDVGRSKQQHFEQNVNEGKRQEYDVQQLSKLLAKLNLPVASIVQEAGSIGQRISEGQTLLVKREDLSADIKAFVEHFDQKIAAQSGTGFYDTWERSRAECSFVNDQGVRSLDHVRLVKHLDQLINVLIPQKVSAIREQGRIFGLALSQYYKILKDVEGQISNQSKRISKEVDEELFLDGVSDSAVKIRSKISELEFWPELQQFNEYYREWIEQGAHELPGDEYAFSMRRVIEILGRSALTGGISKLLDIELHIREGNSDLIIRTDRQLNESSSHGMAYLILCKFLLAFTRLLRGKNQTIIHWPIDELGTLHQSNIKKIFDACKNNNIYVVGAFPNPESEVLTLFKNRYLIDKQKKQLQVVLPQINTISEKLKARKQQEEIA